MTRINPYLNGEDVRHRLMGTCCICETANGVNRIVCMDGRAPILGQGWGCLTCNLPPHGAVAVLCEGCHSQLAAGVAAIRFICTGIPNRDGRTPVQEMKGSYKHDATKHLDDEGGW